MGDNRRTSGKYPNLQARHPCNRGSYLMQFWFDGGNTRIWAGDYPLECGTVFGCGVCRVRVAPRYVEFAILINQLLA